MRSTAHNLFIVLGILLCTLFASNAAAHLMPAGRGTINLIDSKAYLVISLPVAAFDFDEKKNTGLSLEALKENDASIKTQLRSRLSLSSDDAAIANFDKILINLPTGEGHDGKYDEDLIVMIVATFANKPQSIELKNDFWTDTVDALTIKATISEGRKTIRSEVGKLSRDEPAYLFFAPESHVLRSTLKSGFMHLVGGIDHLFFVVILLLLSIKRDRWFYLIGTLAASFAAAFYLTVQSSVTLPIAAIEVGIAASVGIVALAFLSPLNRHDRSTAALTIELIVVAILGVIHGLGFAATVFEADTLAHHTTLKAIGFYIGANAGLFFVAAAVAGAVTISRRTVGREIERYIIHAVATCFAITSVYWIVVRLVG